MPSPCSSNSHTETWRSSGHQPTLQRYHRARVVRAIPPTAVARAPAQERRPTRAGNAERIVTRKGTSSAAHRIESVSMLEEKSRSLGIMPAGKKRVKALCEARSAPKIWKAMTTYRAARLRAISPETTTIRVMALGRVCVDGILSRSAMTSHQVNPRPWRNGERIHANEVRIAANEYTPITQRAEISAYREGVAGFCRLLPATRWRACPSATYSARSAGLSVVRRSPQGAWFSVVSMR